MGKFTVLFVLGMILVSVSARAGCRVHVPVREFDHAGYQLRFVFNKLFEEKHYTEVETPAEADQVLSIEGKEFEGRFFRHAIASFRLGGTRVVEDRRCLTQSCSIGDFAKAFQRAYRALRKQVPVCKE